MHRNCDATLVRHPCCGPFRPVSRFPYLMSTIETASPPLLFTPMQLRALELRNRIVLAPMLTYAANGGYVNDVHLMHYGRFAAGGVGLVFLESTKVDPRGCSTPSDTGLWKDEFIPGLKRIVDLVHASGAKAGIQLSHSGRKARRAVPWEGRAPLASHPGVDHGEEWEIIGPSAIPHSDKYAAPREMSRDDIALIVEAWGRAAERAAQAGFDAIEVHGAHGYLIHQFLSTQSNLRNDEYGGSLENRMRFAAEVARRVRRSWPREKPLFYRISAVDDAGWTIEDSIVLSRTLASCGVDVIDCSTGGMLDQASAVESISYGYQVKHARDVRAGANVMTMAVGMIIHADQAEEVLRSGSADLIAIGREFLHNPNWPLDAAQKLGVESACAALPPSSGYWLEKRARNSAIRPSTWSRGIDVAVDP